MEGKPSRGRVKRCCDSSFLLLRQFVLILGKNFLLQFRRPIGTTVEVVVPIVAVAVLVGIRVGLTSPNNQCFVTFPTDTLNIFSQERLVYYAPNTSQPMRDLAAVLRKNLNLTGGSLTGVESEDDFLSLIADTNMNWCFSSDSPVGIWFDEETIGGRDIRYTIRMRPEVVWDTRDTGFTVVGARVEPNTYFNEGFMHLLKIVDESIIEWKTNESLSFDVNVKQFPYPKYRRDTFLQFVDLFLSLFIVLSLIYTAGTMVKEIVLEKELRTKETMKMMGLSNWILTATWFLKELIFLFVPILIVAILLKYGMIYSLSNLFLLLLFLMFYVSAGIAFCFFISVWFSSSRIGLMAGFIAWFATYFPYFFLSGLYDTLSLDVKIGTCLLSNTCGGLGTKVLSILELRGDGLQFSNFANPISLDDQFSMGWVVLMLFIDTVLYMALYWYIDAVKPGKYGTPRPFYFPFLPSYWCGKRPVKAEDIAAFLNPQTDPSAHEAEPSGLEVGISIQNLTKIYNRRNPKRRKVAVESINLNMYKGQITALLGHNGAGKTTTMSMLTGLYTPTSGTALVNGYNITSEMDLIRRNLGICPQHNVLFDRLTVSEHLAFFALLKGLEASKVRAEVSKMVEDLQLTDKKGTQAQKLSGGMKRKLSVGIALIGGSEIVVLDEPTSGMDPYARRATWDLLVKHKEGRTILLTTHFMDEADLLGDRIAIMAEGHIKCSGSSLFLKNRYGIGYHLTIVKEPECDSLAVSGLVMQHIKGAEKVTDVGTELSLILPSQSVTQFPGLFDTLEKNKEELKISSFGLSITTMEEVFIKVGQGEEETLMSRLERQASRLGEFPPSSPVALEEPGTVKETAIEADLEKKEVTVKPDNEAMKTHVVEQLEIEEFPSKLTVNTGIILWFQQFWAVFMKRFYNFIRFWANVVWQLIIPLIFVILSLVFAVTVGQGDVTTEPSRVISVPRSALSSNRTFFWAQFGSAGDNVSFEDADTGAVGITNYVDYTNDIMQLKRTMALNNTNVGGCCQYEYQILDKFCATRDPKDFVDREDNFICSNSSFGYKECRRDCLKCIRHSLPTCTGQPVGDSPFFDTSDNFCPLPPSVAFTDLDNRDTLVGPLDGYDVYIAERLLRLSGEDLNTNDFFLRVQGGFVLQEKSPAPSSCAVNCSNAPEPFITCLLNETFPPLSERLASSNCDPSTCAGPYQGSLPENCSFLEWHGIFSGRLEQCLNRNIPVDSIIGLVTDETPPPGYEVTVWYNNQPYHMAPASLNAFYTLFLRRKTGQDYTITVTNNPLPRNVSDQAETADNSGISFAISTLSVFGMSFLFASFILFLVEEKDSKAKHIQFVSGVQASSYWLSTFAFDMLNALIPSILILILFAGFDVDGYNKENLAAIFFLLILTNWAAIPITYIFSFGFSNQLIAFAIMVIFFYFIGLILQVSVLLVRALESQSDGDTLHYVALIHPVYALGSALSDMFSNENVKDFCTRGDNQMSCKEVNQKYVDSVFEFKTPGIGHVFLYLFIEGIVFMIITLLMERQFFWPEIRTLYNRNVAGSRVAVEEGSDALMDSDVAEEKNRVAQLDGTAEEHAVVIKNLSKVYRSTESVLCPITESCRSGVNHAVKGINLIIPSRECFGLLGVNGAGKTTTFKMLTGDISSSGGTALVSGYDIRSQLRQVQQRVGYCPQFDALIHRLTGRELLTMFARLRGVPEGQINGVVKKEIQRLDLSKYANKRCGTYSGGNKRKLSTAIALVGDPPIVLLDEPTTGMDPATRRFLWNALINVVREGRSVILTSHSMEECEALCTRLAIMVNGQFKCLGSIQHLKSKFGSGYTMQIRVQANPDQPVPGHQLSHRSLRSSFRRQKSDSGTESVPTSPTSPTSPTRSIASTVTPYSVYNTTAVKNFVNNTFPGSVLLEEHQGVVTYQVSSEGVAWSSLFQAIEQNKIPLGIVDYSVSQTTLDQIFISFAKEQYDEDIGL